jgi:hypothetical protein
VQERGGPFQLRGEAYLFFNFAFFIILGLFSPESSSTLFLFLNINRNWKGMITGLFFLISSFFFGLVHREFNYGL